VGRNGLWFIRNDPIFGGMGDNDGDVLCVPAYMVPDVGGGLGNE